MAQDQVRVLTSQLRQSASALATTKAQLDAMRSGAEQSAQAYKELQDVREKLEVMSGNLKVVEAERRSLERAKGELQSTVETERREKERLNAEIIAQANMKLRPEEHPIFGALLYDHGYKKVYRASPTTVWAATPLWEKQRAFRRERAAVIAKAKRGLGVRGWPGTISVAELADGADAQSDGAIGTCVVVDGQHRLGAAHILAADGALHEALSSITVELYPKARHGGRACMHGRPDSSAAPRACR